MRPRRNALFKLRDEVLVVSQVEEVRFGLVLDRVEPGSEVLVRIGDSVLGNNSHRVVTLRLDFQPNESLAHVCVHHHPGLCEH